MKYPQGNGIHYDAIYIYLFLTTFSLKTHFTQNVIVLRSRKLCLVRSDVGFREIITKSSRSDYIFELVSTENPINQSKDD